MPSSASAWRAWIALALTVLTTAIAAALSLFWRSEAYADQRVDGLRQEVCSHLVDIRQDVQSLHDDVRQLLKRRDE